MRVLNELSYGPYGQRSLLDLYLPDGVVTSDALVACYHGGGWQGGPRDQFKWMCERLADRGIPCATITYRYWPTSRHPAALEDAHRSIRWLRMNANRSGFKAERVAAVGSSAGAHLASCIPLIPMLPERDPELAKYSSDVACVVDISGPVNFPAMMTSESAPIVAGYMGMPFSAETEGAYRAASPPYFVKSKTVPFLIIHGTLDVGEKYGQVPITIADDFAARLRSVGTDVTLLHIEGEGHGFSPAGQEKVWQAVETFFAKQLDVLR